MQSRTLFLTILICLSTLIISCGGESSGNSGKPDTSGATTACGGGGKVTISGQDACEIEIDAP